MPKRDYRVGKKHNMNFVNIDSDSKLITIQITIEFVGPWHYIYAKLYGEERFEYSSALADKPQPHIFKISDGNKAFAKRDVWGFDLKNPTTRDLDYFLKIEWFQESEHPISVWPKLATEQKGKIAAEGIKTFDDLCKYI